MIDTSDSPSVPIPVLMGTDVDRAGLHHEFDENGLAGCPCLQEDALDEITRSFGNEVGSFVGRDLPVGQKPYRQSQDETGARTRDSRKFAVDRLDLNHRVSSFAELQTTA